MELKEGMHFLVSWDILFQSHLYGIERCEETGTLHEAVCFNRTFMELKDEGFDFSKLKAQFQSHLYGIERCLEEWQRNKKNGFQSHLYGIESTIIAR